MLTPGQSGWWPGVDVVSAADLPAAGADYGIRVRSPLGYHLRVRLRITEFTPPRGLAAASTGDLVGEGRVRLQPTPAGTVARIEWTVAVQRGWMRRAAPVLRPVFVLAHAVVMWRGERAARARLRRA